MRQLRDLGDRDPDRPAAELFQKRQVGIESLAGPTETLVLADDSADARYVAADLLAQSEHLGAEPVLVSTSRTRSISG